MLRCKPSCYDTGSCLRRKYTLTDRIGREIVCGVESLIALEMHLINLRADLTVDG